MIRLSKNNLKNEILFRKIGGYLSSALNNSNLCFVIDNNQDNLSGFLLTINESENYDKFIQSKWIEQLHQKYPNVDHVNFFFKFFCIV